MYMLQDTGLPFLVYDGRSLLSKNTGIVTTKERKEEDDGNMSLFIGHNALFIYLFICQFVHADFKETKPGIVLSIFYKPQMKNGIHLYSSVILTGRHTMNDAAFKSARVVVGHLLNTIQGDVDHHTHSRFEHVLHCHEKEND